MGALIDPISVLLLVVVTVVSTLVHVYSLGYMKGDPGFGRYFSFLSLFTFSMIGLVLAPNIMQMFVFWELVGVSSYLLIGFYYKTEEAVAASKKAFIVTRFADLFFLTGILVVGFLGYGAAGDPALLAAVNEGSSVTVGPMDFAFINHELVTSRIAGMAFAGMSLLTLSMVLIFIGGAGKSAMFPLHVWLPDAMAGPTPVSALIHAATMVVAGVYLVARLFPAFAASGAALDVVAFIGSFTCLFAAVIACTQADIKRVLAYSTLSQLGYMMFALGIASADHPDGHAASMFHLFTHAFFKALLFLGAGSVIHAVHSNSIWEMGGLRKSMPVTHWTFLIATLAIAGVPPLAGFWSKDAILMAALDNHHPIVFAVGLGVAALTAFYMFRLYVVTFLGDNRTDKASHAHESSAVMLAPLVILALLSVIAGFFGVTGFVGLGENAGHHSENALLVESLSIAAGLIGIGLAFHLYRGDGARAEAVANRLGSAYRVIQDKFYIDELYLFVTHKVIIRFISTPAAWFDRHIVDGTMNLAAWLTCRLGAVLNRTQTGQVQTYGVWIVNGAVLVLLFVWLVVRD
jgi:NADH-quinone oxidoreductase subunit L